MVPPFHNNVAFQYAYYGTPLAPNVQSKGKIAQDDTLAAQTLNPTMMYHMFPQFMPQMPAKNIVQPPHRVSTKKGNWDEST